jgi:alkylation response protein AidB-like acyl-CoA dehydrogenase
MVFEFTAEHQALRDSVRAFARQVSPEAEVRRMMALPDGYDRATWARMAGELGLPGLAVPQRYGGAGAGLVEAAIVLEETGRFLLPGPLLSTLMAAAAIVHAAEEYVAGSLLPGICAGETIATLALAEAGGSWDADGVGCTATQVAGGGWRLDGRKRYVPDAHAADLLVAAARTVPDGVVALFAVDPGAGGVTVEPLTAFDLTRRLSDVALDAAAAVPLAHPGAQPVDEVLDLVRVLVAAEQVGTAQAALDMAVGYARERVQFGRAIGSFQAIKHMCADVLLDVESARSAAYFAAWAADSGSGDLPVAAPLARAFCADTLLAAAALNMQVHGGLCFTWEHPAHLFFRRAKAGAQLWGDAQQHRELLVTRLGGRPRTWATPAAAVAVTEAADPQVPAEAGGAADLVRAEVRAWLAENWSQDRPREAWRRALAESGWAAPTWPPEWFGRGLAPASRRIVAEEFLRAGADGAGQDVLNLYANVILAHGTDEQKRRFVWPLALGEHRGCLLYSEPGAGSDLAAVQTRADRDGDDWVITGQKVWTSGAAQATHGLLVARSDWDVPKHQGLTFFWFPMRQPGVDVRPIRQVTGGAEFNEVFFDGARVPDANRLGEPGGGWRVLLTALGFERLLMGADLPLGRPRDEQARTPAEITADRQSPWTRQVGGADYFALARISGRDTDPVIRQEIARLYTLEQVNAWNAMRATSQSGPGAASPLASLGKLAFSRIVHTGVALTTRLLGAEALLDGDSSPVAAEVNRSAFAAYVTSVGGGTDQIQRNIIGERLLGLPKEPEADRDVPFRDVRKARAARRLSGPQA